MSKIGSGSLTWNSNYDLFKTFCLGQRVKHVPESKIVCVAIPIYWLLIRYQASNALSVIFTYNHHCLATSLISSLGCAVLFQLFTDGVACKCKCCNLNPSACSCWKLSVKHSREATFEMWPFIKLVIFSAFLFYVHISQSL